MNLLQRIEVWGDRHHPKWLDIIRISLGILLVWKGVSFMSNTEALRQMVDNSPFSHFSMWIVQYVAYVHFMGGILIAIGLVTRVAVLFQLPILIGAIAFVNIRNGLFSYHSELAFSIVVLVLLLFFLIEGSGPISIDEYLRRHPERKGD